MSTSQAIRPMRTGKPYADGELVVILSLAATRENIQRLARLLERSQAAIEIVYRKALQHGAFATTALSQIRKIAQAKAEVGIAIGRR